MRKDLMRLHQMMTKIKNPLKNVEGEETKEDSTNVESEKTEEDSTDEKVDPKYAEANALGVKTGDLSGMPASTASIVYTARINAARNAKNNN